ncbi:hypothetical protein EJ08DRAFT_655313 [Tothia fuscella]|uniref:Gamma-glutamylcyclotransferase AIG2-like domain-containing protein n=1 Tax=Tothia fuscella TaxID=1048955 RepID=A0A9P4U4Z5_9PEZI|nr:hypothetical protein EJ08DRAFT_655313 [Tothia fuscella]
MSHTVSKRKASDSSSFDLDSQKRREIQEQELNGVPKAQEVRKLLPEPGFQPGYMLFYGSLMDPEVLEFIAELEEPPILLQGSVFGFSMKVWTQHPALIPHEGGKVIGRAWKVETEEQFQRLAHYETEAYTILKDCRTFRWAGEVDSKELEDGEFDLRAYQKFTKPAMLGYATSDESSAYDTDAEELSPQCRFHHEEAQEAWDATRQELFFGRLRYHLLLVFSTPGALPKSAISSAILEFVAHETCGISSSFCRTQ